MPQIQSLGQSRKVLVKVLSLVLILMSRYCSWLASFPKRNPLPVCKGCRSRSLAAEHNFPLSAWRGLGDGGKQQRWRSRRGEARGWDREVGGEGRGGSRTRWKKQLYTNDRLPYPHNAASMPPQTPHLQWCCPVRSSNSFKEAGEARRRPNPQRDCLPLLLR